ncbi:hypothetical protein NIES4101_87860 [Calothrix sp. NIES-4101]|nr:hypothetical protein NIES4101_87860 [Calothrix sp. NIES-4101]
MQKLRTKRILLLPFIILGFGYFYAVSSVGVDEFWKSQIALIPVQLGAVIYFTYLHWGSRQSK